MWWKVFKFKKIGFYVCLKYFESVGNVIVVERGWVL